MQEEELLADWDFEADFQTFVPIILKARRLYVIEDWDLDDYLQEGRILLHRLRLTTEQGQIYTHFKVRYQHLLIDCKRRSRAKKRYLEPVFVAEAYETYELSPKAKGRVLRPDDEMIYQGLEGEILTKLSPSYQRLFKRQMRGETISRADRYRLKAKIKQILFDEEEGLEE